ncbi:MAG: tetratricopeptide repeat protein [Acidobacteriota bacterium]
MNDAEKLYTRALWIMRHKYGEDHYETASHLTNLASLHQAKGENSEAEWLFWQALTVKEKAVGPDHIDCALTMIDLTNLYKRQRRFDEAELLCSRALNVLEKRLEPEHPFLIKCRKTCNELSELLDVVTVT